MKALSDDTDATASCDDQKRAAQPTGTRARAMGQ